jgi:hypothetical protein
MSSASNRLKLRRRVVPGSRPAADDERAIVGLLNVLRVQATNLVRDPEKVKELTEKVKEKAGDYQAKRKADAILEELGRFTYAERTDRAHPNGDVETARLVAQLRALEDGGVVILPPEEPQPG